EDLQKLDRKQWHDLLALGVVSDSATSGQWEYALNAYSNYVMTGQSKSRKKLIETYCNAINESSLQKRKNFFISQLQLIGDKKALKCLAPLIDGTVSGEHAVRAISTIGTKQSGKILLKALANGDAQTKKNIIAALGQMKYLSSAKIVEGYALSEDKEISSIAMTSLNKMGASTQLSNIQRTIDEQIIKVRLQGRTSPSGFNPIFNGKDLTGWKGLVANPIQRSKMTPAQLTEMQVKADSIMQSGWKVANGLLVFTGHGDNLCTQKQYGDFEMLVDWKITKDGDAGIYLRGTPQVQIWDIARTDAGAQVGSGGLYNNQKNPSKPLVLADNPIGEWNSFHIIMKGDRVTVYLNNKLVADNVVLENYWDRNLPIFSREQIELQAHGTYVAYRNIFIKEL
ncbi:MAG: family 16 glycoside hydrolase, partial [Flavitalea sp.]